MGIKFGQIISISLDEKLANQALEPTTLAVTISAAQKVAPVRVVAHLQR